jgi:hypothetical protein
MPLNGSGPADDILDLSVATNFVAIHLPTLYPDFLIHLPNSLCFKFFTLLIVTFGVFKFHICILLGFQ